MATVINNPTRTRDEAGSGLGVILAVILVVALAVLLFVFGIPALRGSAPANTFDVNLNSGAGAAEGTMTQ